MFTQSELLSVLVHVSHFLPFDPNVHEHHKSILGRTGGVTIRTPVVLTFKKYFFKVLPANSTVTHPV